MIHTWYRKEKSVFRGYFALQGTGNKQEQSNLIQWVRHFFLKCATVANQYLFAFPYDYVSSLLYFHAFLEFTSALHFAPNWGNDRRLRTVCGCYRSLQTSTHRQVSNRQPERRVQ